MGTTFASGALCTCPVRATTLLLSMEAAGAFACADERRN